MEQYDNELMNNVTETNNSFIINYLLIINHK